MRLIARIWMSAGLVLFAAAQARASDRPDAYPDRPIHLIVPFAPGGGTDNLARIMAKYLGNDLKQAVVVQNYGGGGGTIGAQRAVNAKPDGYTLILGAASYATNAALYKLPYDPVNDITPIAMVARTGYVIVANPSLHIDSLSQLISYAKSHPGKLNFGSSGTGGLSHLGMVLFEKKTGIDMTHVPYKGIGPATTDLLAGNIQLMLGDMSASIPLINSGKLAAIGVTTAKRVKALPSVPAVSEKIPSYHVELWFAIWGPRGMPGLVVQRINSAVARVVKFPEVRKVMSSHGLTAWVGPPAMLRSELKTDIGTWSAVLKDAGIQKVVP